jgi:purine-cytosine permease-like protein
LVLTIKAGFDPGTPAKVLFILIAVGVQIVLPFLGHATIVKTLRLLIIPFAVLFAVLLGFSVHHAHLNAVAHGAGWQTYMVGLAFTITLSGLGWAECGNDYSRYLPREASNKAIVGWVFLGTAVTSVGTSANAFLPLVHQSFIPAWFVVVFLLFSMVQLFAINSLDLYSSGVTLQALGVKVKRYQAVIVDSVICLGVTIYAIFDSSFGTYLRDFVDVVIVWIAPWVAIYLVDWGMRKWRYVPSELQRVDRGSLYWSKAGIHWPAIIAQFVGMAASMAALSPTFSVPHWVNPIAFHSGADFSVFTGIAAGGIVYAALAWKSVGRQAELQDTALAGAGAAVTR